MTRLLQRGTSTTRLAENGWSHNETPIKLVIDEEEGESHGKASLLILLSGILRKGLSSQKFQQKAAEIGFKSSDMPDGNSSLRSLLNGPHSYKGFFTQLPDASTLSVYSSQSNSAILGHSAPAQNKKVFSSPIAKIVMLSFISIFILVAVLGSTSTGYSSNPASRIIYSSYRKLHEDFFSLDLMSGGIFGLGALHPKDLTTCPKDMEHHVPCYNASTAVRARINGDFDRHCELADSRTLCLTRPPKNYTLPLQWPESKNYVWIRNTNAADDYFKESRTERITLSEDSLLAFRSQESDGVEMHFQKVADIVGVPDDRSFSKIGVRTVLDIGCSYGAFVAHLLSRDVQALCVAPYETQNSHVQIALDRGLPAIIGSLMTNQLPYPASSFNMIHCADCGIDWSQKDGLLLLEIDRLLKANGYFVWTMPALSHDDALAKFPSERILRSINEATKSMCWDSLPPQDQVYIWRKGADRLCSARSNRTWDVCDDARNVDIALYGSLRHCLDATKDGPSEQQLDSLVSGFSSEEISDDPAPWLLTVRNYWSIITPLLFSDHPKRPAEDDPLPPANIVRNVMDMNALYGGFNSGLLQAGKAVWVMNVVPMSGPNTLPMIYRRGLTGTLHDWCEAFPTYPRTYDLLHGIGLLSQVVKTGCSLSNLLLDMDRILRPEGWVLLRDSAEIIEEARVAASQMRWEARTIEVEGNDDFRLLVCQKGFWKT